jgi:hypothetical protein
VLVVARPKSPEQPRRRGQHPTIPFRHPRSKFVVTFRFHSRVRYLGKTLVGLRGFSLPRRFGIRVKTIGDKYISPPRTNTLCSSLPNGRMCKVISCRQSPKLKILSTKCFFSSFRHVPRYGKQQLPISLSVPSPYGSCCFPLRRVFSDLAGRHACQLPRCFHAIDIRCRQHCVFGGTLSHSQKLTSKLHEHVSQERARCYPQHAKDDRNHRNLPHSKLTITSVGGAHQQDISGQLSFHKPS